MRIAVIGGGVAGLTCAIRLAEAAHHVVLFEAAPRLGGRTRSFFHAPTGTWVDNGPHLLIGAYSATRQLLHDCNADDMVYWQPTLHLPLWHPAHGLGEIAPDRHLPLHLGLPLACYRMPGHDWRSVTGLIRLFAACRQRIEPDFTLLTWLRGHRVPPALCHDLLEPLCLGAMNDPMESANAASFARVLRESFARHDTARLGWFRAPISEALIRPLATRAEALGVEIRTRARIRSLRGDNGGVLVRAGTAECFERTVIALPATARNTLLGWSQAVETRPICNLHLWFEPELALPAPVVGSLDTKTQWFFDVTCQHDRTQGGPPRWRHLCTVISADTGRMPVVQRLGIACEELAGLLGLAAPPRPVFHRLVCERRATVLVRPHRQAGGLPWHVIDASEQPGPGSLPATIELAVRRGESAAAQLQMTS